MERGSTQHSRRIDEKLAEEVEPLVRSGSEARADESRLHEPPADDEPLPDARIAGEDTPMPGSLGLDDLEARSLLATSLRPSVFPAARDELLAVAEDEHAPPDVLEALAALPAGRRFVNVQQVWEALGGERERRGVEPGPEATAEPEVAPAELGGVEPEPVPPVQEQPRAPRRVQQPAAATAASPRSDPLWLTAARTGVGIATLPLRLSIEVLRAARDRITHR